MFKNMAAARSSSVLWARGARQGPLSVPIPVFINTWRSVCLIAKSSDFCFSVIASRRIDYLLALQKMHEIALDL